MGLKQSVPLPGPLQLPVRRNTIYPLDGIETRWCRRRRRCGRRSRNIIYPLDGIETLRLLPPPPTWE